MGQVLTDCCKDPNALPHDGPGTPRPQQPVSYPPGGSSEVQDVPILKPIDPTGAPHVVNSAPPKPAAAKPTPEHATPAKTPQPSLAVAGAKPAKADPNETYRPTGELTTDEWSNFLKQWLVDPGYCVAAGLAPTDTGFFYAASPSWDAVWWENHVEMILQDDDSELPMQINETSCLLEALQSGTAPLGLWLGGNKYKVIQRDANFQSGDYTYTWLFGKRPEMGVHIVSTGSTIVAGIYDEGQQQTSGNAKHGVVAVAEYLAQSGY